VNVLSCSTSVTMAWTAASDALSGLGRLHRGLEHFSLDDAER
jgi:hypothetical protein